MIRCYPCKQSSICSVQAWMWLHPSTPRLALDCNNEIILWNCSRPVCSQTSTPGPCPITATLSMWCELINITDAAQATRHEALLKVSCNVQENMFGWCKSMTFGIKTSNTVILNPVHLCFVFLTEWLLHIEYGCFSLELSSITFKSLLHHMQISLVVKTSMPTQ